MDLQLLALYFALVSDEAEHEFLPPLCCGWNLDLICTVPGSRIFSCIAHVLVCGVWPQRETSVACVVRTMGNGVGIVLVDYLLRRLVIPLVLIACKVSLISPFVCMYIFLTLGL